MLLFFFFNDTATTEIYTLSLHDALPISDGVGADDQPAEALVEHADDARVGLDEAHLLDGVRRQPVHERTQGGDRKSTRLNSSHSQISYAVFCLKKKKKSITESMS